MAKKNHRDMLVALDIGTSKVVAIVGEVNEANAPDEIEIVGIGSSPSHGMKKGRGGQY